MKNFIEFCHYISSKGLSKCSSGNMSKRAVDNNNYWITTSGSWFERITEEDIVLCNLKNGITKGGNKPSSENEIHRRTLVGRKDINVILHCQPPNGTAISCMKGIDVVSLNMIPEIPYYIGDIKIVHYYHPGSKELTDSVVNSFLEGFNLVIAQNHGIFLVGKDYDEVLQRISFFELACGIFLQLKKDNVHLGESDINRLKSGKK